MRKFVIPAILLYFCISFVRSEVAEPLFVPGQVIVKFKPSAVTAAAAGLSALGYADVEKIGGSEVHVMQTRPYQSVEAAVAEFESRSDVIFAQPNYIYRGLRTAPNDPTFPLQFHLERIRAPEAWDIDTGAGYHTDTIAIVDAGSDTDHGDFVLNQILVAGTDIIDGDSDPSDGGGSGHGMAVAGIAGAVGNNAVKVAGVNWEARLMPVRVLTGINATGNSLDVESGIRKAIANRARVINLSLGFSTSAVDDLLENAIRDAVNAGIIVVAAAGNDGNANVIYPASSHRTIAVGSTNSSNARSSFSNFGAGSGVAGLDVMAPGEGIYTLGLNNGDTTFTGALTRSGTSFSTPIVTAAAALVRSRRPGITPEQFRTFLRSTAADIGDAGWDERTGAGLIDLFRLLTVATAESSYGDTLATANGGTSSVQAIAGWKDATAAPITGTNSFLAFDTHLAARQGSIQFYFRPDSSQATTDTRFILTQRGNLANGSGNISVLLRSDSRVEWRMQDTGTLVSKTILNAGQWYHIALSYGPRGMILFINGDSEATDPDTGGPPTADTVYLGAPSTHGESARGRFDRLAFFDSQTLLFPSALFARVESFAAASSTTENQILVGWKAFQTETNTLRVDVYADDDTSGFNGTLLHSGLYNDQNEFVSIRDFTLDVPRYIYVVVTDTESVNGEQAYAYAAAALTKTSPAVVTVGGAAGGSGAGCVLSRTGWEINSLRGFRDWLLSHLTGRCLTKLYYSVLG